MAKKASKVKRVSGAWAKPAVAKAPKSKANAAAGSGGVDEVARVLESYDVQTRAVVEAIRESVGAFRRVETGVKWNSVSFRTTGTSGEWFATVNVRAREGLVLVLHTGAKCKMNLKAQLSELAGAKELRWMDAQRAAVSVESAEAWKQKWKALKRVVSQWAECVRT